MQPATSNLKYDTIKALRYAKTGKKTNGDVYKKYVDGVLKRQIFVPKERVKKMIQKSLAKVKKNARKTLKIGGAAAEQPKQKPQVIYVQAPPAPAQQAQAQQVVVQDGTSFGQALKTGAASGLGWGLAHAFIGALFSGDD